MKKIQKNLSVPLLGIIAIMMLANWSSETSSGGAKENKVNFSGTLITQSGTVLEVDNISIEWLYSQIPVYEMPSAKDAAAPDHKLSKDPLAGIVTRIDLSETHAIKVPNPEILWSYQKEKGFRNAEYIEIQVISNDEKTSNNYLINIRRKIHCRENNPAGPIEKDVPLQAVKELIIKDYKARDDEKMSKKEKKALAKSKHKVATQAMHA